MEQAEPIDPAELQRNAYRDAYKHPLKLNASGGIHTDDMDRARRFAGNERGDYGTYTKSREIGVDVGDEEPEVMETSMLLDDVIDAMVQGTKDKIEGREPRPDIVL